VKLHRRHLSLPALLSAEARRVYTIADRAVGCRMGIALAKSIEASAEMMGFAWLNPSYAL